MIVYLEHTSKDGKSYVEHHQVWDRERFISAQQDLAQADGGTVAVVSRLDYRLFKGYKVIAVETEAA